MDGCVGRARRAWPAVLLAIIAWPAAICGAVTLEQESSLLCDRYRQNMLGIKTLDLTFRMSTSTQGATAMTVSSPREQVIWDRGRGKLKNKTLVSEPRAYVADSQSKTIEYVNGSSSVFKDQLDDAQAVSMTTPFPGWLWRPEWLMPSNPTQVREEGAALVMVFGGSHPRREIWLDRRTALLVKFVDTDAKGNVMRIASCRDWTSTGDARVPREIEEELRTRNGTLRRIIILEANRVNAALPDSEYALP